MADLVYNGTQLIWNGHGVFKNSFKASSGRDGYQDTSVQNLSDLGPIPEGLFAVPLKIGGTSATRIKKKGGGLVCDLDKKAEIQTLPLADVNVTYDGQSYTCETPVASWGINRVRLRTIRIYDKKNSHRAGFYIHDSTKGHSAGCIEVESSFFFNLRAYAEKVKQKGELLLEVKYTGSSTYGGTKVP